MKKSLASLGTSRSISRRRMLTTSGAAALTVAAGDWFTAGLFSSRRAIGQESKNDRPRIGCIGTGGQGTYIGERAKNYGDIVAVCDVNEAHLNFAGQRHPNARTATDFRKLFDHAGEFDAVLALYHDQGHIAIKVHNFEDSVTATMGIPFVRTSVDHGTAFDIAGKNLANAEGLYRAIEAAIDMMNGTLR